MSDIIKTQQGLARKAETNKTQRFEDVSHLLCKREWLEEALQQVLANEGSQTAGIDGRSWKSFNEVDKSDLENEKVRRQFSETLQKELKAHPFKPRPVRRGEIPKPGTNKKRPLGIPTLKDRTGQTRLNMLREALWEADFFYFSNGFREGTLHQGWYSALGQTVQHHKRIPMADRGRQQGVFRPHPARQGSH